MSQKKSDAIKVKEQSNPRAYGEEVLLNKSIVNKELNVYGKSMIFLGYSALVIITTLFISNNKRSDVSKSEMFLLKKQQLAILEALEGSESNKVSTHWYEASKSSLNSSVDEVKKTLVELREYDTYSREVINLQKKKIEELQERIKQQDYLKKVNIAESKTETIPYSEANYDTILYQHRLKINRLKEKHRIQEKAFTSVMDLNQPSVKEKWVKFVDGQKIEVRKLENDLRSERKNFRKNKYITMISN